MNRILVIQTAFIGDVILATAVVEKLHQYFPDAKIDFLLRKGNENILEGHTVIHNLLVWDKQNRKYASLMDLVFTIRSRRYDLVVNLQRFFSSGLLTVLSGAKITVGFDKSPLSIFFSHTQPHRIGLSGKFEHEVERNLSLISKWTDDKMAKPRIHLLPSDFEKKTARGRYITISPASIWMTKQYPLERWIAFTDRVEEDTSIFLLGGKSDIKMCEVIREQSSHRKIEILAGQLSLRESAAFMTGAIMNYTNDSAPLHLASAVNAPVTAVFCSTIPAFGFTPLSDVSHVVETKENLACRPCGLHGKKKCPEGHFKCSSIESDQLLEKMV